MTVFNLDGAERCITPGTDGRDMTMPYPHDGNAQNQQRLSFSLTIRREAPRCMQSLSIGMRVA